MRQLIRTAFGQGLVILATLIPVISGQHAALAASVFCGSLAGLLLLPLLASVPTRLPGVADDGQSRSLLRVGAAVVATTAVLLLLVAVAVIVLSAAGLELAVFVGNWRLSDVVVGVLMLLVAQALYTLLVSWYTRQGDMRGIGFLRTVYGASAIAFAGVAILFGDGFYQVIVAASAAMFLSSVVTVCARHRGLRSFLRSLPAVRPRHYLTVWRDGWRLSLAGAANGFTAQAAGLVLPALGSLTEVWAVVLRVGGGFTTIMQTVVAPFIERDLGAASRAQDGRLFRRNVFKGWGVGLVAGVIAAAAGVLAASLTGARPLDGTMLVVMISAGLYFVGQTGTGAVSRAVAIAGWQGAQLAWDLARFVVFVLLVVLLSGAILLVSIAAAMFVFAIIFVIIALRAPSRQRWQW